jgi:hypothetical protein
LRVKVLAAPTATVATLTRRNSIGTTTTGAIATSTFTIVPPADSLTGDLLVAFIGRQNQTVTVPAGWTAAAEILSDPTSVQARLMILYAFKSPTLSYNFTLSAGSPILTHCVAFAGFSAGTPFGLGPTTSGVNNGAAVITFPNHTVTTGNGVGSRARIMYVALSRYASADEGRVHTWTGTDVASIATVATSRGATFPDLQMSVAEIADNATTGQSAPLATVGDSGGPSTVSWCLAALSISEGAVAGAATRLTVQMMVK